MRRGKLKLHFKNINKSANICKQNVTESDYFQDQATMATVSPQNPSKMTILEKKIGFFPTLATIFCRKQIFPRSQNCKLFCFCC